MNGFYIQISNGLITDQHRKRMGSAIWEFMWLLDKITKIDDYGNGHVLGGKAINLEDIASDLGTHPSSVSENLSKLEREDYIERHHIAYGIVIVVKKAKKRFGQKTKAHLEKTKPDSEKTKRTIYKTVDKTVDTLPLWLDKEAWGRWETHRKEIKKKQTPSSVKLQLKKLEADKRNHVAMIDQAIEKGWTSIFPLKENDGKRQDRQTYQANRNIESEDERVREIDNKSKEIAKNFKI